MPNPVSRGLAAVVLLATLSAAGLAWAASLLSEFPDQLLKE